jgi:hypothetical protein
MSDLDSALWKRILYIVQEENRPFSYTDFVPTFTVDNKSYPIAKTTFRNKVSILRKEEKIAVAYYSSIAFYTIKGIGFDKPSIHDRTGVELPLPLSIPPELAYVKNDPLYRSIRTLPFGQKSLHNIRLRFKAKGLWSAISSCSSSVYKCKMNVKSKDVTLPRIAIDKLGLCVNVHRSDTVSIIVSCSYGPITVDVNGVTRLSNALAAVHKEVSEFAVVNDNVSILIPDYMEWIVTMWHFGADATVEYSDEKNYRRWGIAEKILLTIYTKEWKDGKRRVRWDLQEYPNKAVKEALEEKLSECNSSCRLGV